MPLRLTPLLSALVIWLCTVLPNSWAQSASPNWQATTATERGQFYIDPASVRRVDGIVRVRTLLDYKLSQLTHNGKAFRSAVSLMEIDCKSDTGRIVEMSYHPAPMMGGPRVETQGMVQDWQNISPESPVRRIAARVCK